MSTALEANQTRCKPPISEDEVKKVAESAAKYPAGRPFADDDAREKGEPGGRSPNPLIELAATADLFHTPDRVAYASIEVDGHIETHGIKSRTFKQWLTRRFYEESGKPPRTQNLDEAIATLDAEFDRLSSLLGVRYSVARKSFVVGLSALVVARAYSPLVELLVSAYRIARSSI